MRDMKLRDMKMRYKTAGWKMRDMENASNAAYVRTYRNAATLAYCVECEVTCNLI